MTIKVHSENLILINNLTKTSDRLATAMGRLSTGYRINSASDGAAELILSKGLEKQISGLSVCNDNANMAKSLLTVADGSLSEITSMAQRIRDIALSSANGIYSEDERRAYQSEVNALVEEIKRQTDEARYNDYKLFYGAQGPEIKSITQNAGAGGAGTSGVVGTYKVQKVSKEEAEAQGYTCVSTAQELKDALVSGDSSCKVMLMADINLDDLGLDATGSNWTAVGTTGSQFMGTLDGNGYTIRNLKIDATSGYQGLFGYTATSSTIKNLNIDNADVKSTGNYTGVLVGINYGTIENCSVVGSYVKSENQRAGGLVGENIGKISNCKTDIVAEGLVNIGGFVGMNYGEIILSSSFGEVASDRFAGGFTGQNCASGSYVGVIKDCYSEANVRGRENTGGFVGAAYYNSEITSCYATGDVVGNGSQTGGFAGTTGDTSSISLCYATGNVEGKQFYTGGFVGRTQGASSLISCHSTGVVSGEEQVGGFVGTLHNSSFITSCYSTGDVIGNSKDIGGFAGAVQQTSRVTSCMASGNVTGGGANIGGFVGISTQNAIITSCCATGNVRSNSYCIGGFIGLNNSTELLSFSYATGKVTGVDKIGGFVGGASVGSLFDSCYSTGDVVGTNITGGFVGILANGATVSNSYSSGNVTGTTVSTGSFIGQAYSGATLSNYAFSGTSGHGIGTGSGAAVGADDTAGKDASWFKDKSNLISILGEDWDYSYLNSNLTFQVGVNAGSLNTLDINLSFGVDNLRIDVMSGDSSRESINVIDELIEYTTQVQGRIGSSMNALDSVLGNNTQTQINLTESNSRLIDADIARESAEVVKTQIRQNMTASLLAQTGTNMSQIVLALYGL